MRGIPFCPGMVKALQNTRINEQPAWPIEPAQPFKRFTRRIPKVQDLGILEEHGPHYLPGKRYVVREGLRRGKVTDQAYYQGGGLVCPDNPLQWRWKNDKLRSIFMPDIAGRLFVQIINADLRKLQSMTGMDCVFEGLLVTNDEMTTAFGAGRWGAKEEADAYLKKFADLIDSLHGQGTWESNPWCWAYEIMRVSTI